MSAKRLKLDNGMTLLLEEHRSAPVVALQAWVHVGSADEADVESGVAHLHEHMLFKGTQRRGVGEIARTVEASGGEINAWTSFDQTVYHVVLAADELSTGVDILSDALRNSAFDPDELGREIEVVVEEILRAEDAPARRVSKALFDLAFSEHPYRRPVLGTQETVRSMTRERVVDFYGRHYRPDRVTLVAVGDFDAEQMRAEAERWFGDWSANGNGANVERPPEPKQRESRFSLLEEDVREARCAIAWHIPSVEHEDIPALDALSVVLGHGESSRLQRELRRRLEIVNDVYSFPYTPRDPGLFMVGAGLKEGRVRDGVEALFDEVYRTRQRRFTSDELDKAKVILLSDAAYQKETVQGQARKLGFYQVVAGDFAFEERYFSAIESLTPDDLLSVAERYLTEAPTMVVQTPDGSDAPDGVSAPVPAEALSHLSGERFEKAKTPRHKPAVGAQGVTRVELEGGAVLLLKPEPSPVVAFRAVSIGGQRDESIEEAGIGQLFSCVWGSATPSLDPAALARRVAMLGGSVSSFSGRNAQGMRGEFIAQKAQGGLQVFLDALLEPRFEAADLDRERKAIEQRIANRDNSAGGVAFDTFAKTLFPNHPYGRRLSGTVDSLRALTEKAVRAHGEAVCSAPRYAISAVGGFDIDHTLDVLRERLSSTVSAPAAPSISPDPAPSEPVRVVKELDKKQSHLMVGSMGTTLDDPDRFPLEVMTTVLSGQSGRLFLDLRDKRSLAYSVSCSALEGIDPGHVVVHMGTSPDKVDEGLAGIHEHLERMRQEAIGEEELARAKRYLIGTYAIDLQRCGARAMTMGLGERFGLGYDHYVGYPKQIAAITASDVQRVAQRFLEPSRLIEVIVGP